MSLFDNLFGDTAASAELTGQEAFAGILLAASVCDGHSSRDELRSLSAITERMRLFENTSTNKWNAIVDRLMKILHREGPLTTADRCAKSLPDGLRECAFANACDIVLADGMFEPEEKEFLDHLHTALDLDGDTALNIVEVMIFKNKG